MGSRTAAKIAGVSLLAMALLAIFANFFVLESLITAGDASTTAANIADSEGLFRLGIAAFLLVAILDVVVAAALYVLLKPANQSLALLAAGLRLVYASILAAALFNLVLVAELAGGTEYLSLFSQDQLQGQIMFFLDAFNYGWLIGLIFFGLHLLVLGYLIYRSGFAPWIIGVLLIVASLGYLADSFANVLMPDYADYEMLFLILVAGPAVAGELSLTFWLLFRGGKRQPLLEAETLPAVENTLGKENAR